MSLRMFLAPRLMLSAVSVTSLVLVVLAVVMGELLRLAACPLCIFQRVLYLALAVLALIAALLPQGRGRTLFIFAALAVALGGVAAAGWQSWLQAFPDPALECSYSDPNMIERLVDWLGMQWPRLFMATGFCSSKEWTLAGLSMANWSVLTFLLLAGGLVMGAKRR